MKLVSSPLEHANYSLSIQLSSLIMQTIQAGMEANSN